ncbi:glycosyltransferase family 2 protein [Rhodobacteraceae bacterium nBUS_22]
MTIYVVIPTFNRIKQLSKLLSDLQNQEGCLIPVEICVVNDASTDETSEALEHIEHVNVIATRGNRWWPGAINDAIHFLKNNRSIRQDDYILLLNDDTRLPASYLRELMSIACLSPKVCVGSMIKDIDTSEVISVGACYNRKKLKITDCIDKITQYNNVIELSLLSGRGTLYPAIEFMALGKSNEFFTPQYFADYLISFRFKQRSYDLVTHPNIFVYSDTNFGNMKKFRFLRKYFWRRSSNYIIAKVYFDIITIKKSLILFYPLIVIGKGVWKLRARSKI